MTFHPVFKPNPLGLRLSSSPALSGATFAGIKLGGVQQSKPMHRFLPYFQEIFTTRGSKLD